LNLRISLGTALGCAACAVPLAALAQNGTENYYFPPKIATFGKSTLPVTGHGNVVVKVLVNANGTFAVQNVLRSSDPADNAVALDIAKHSTYHPATKGTSKTRSISRAVAPVRASPRAAKPGRSRPTKRNFAKGSTPTRKRD